MMRSTTLLLFVILTMTSRCLASPSHHDNLKADFISSLEDLIQWKNDIIVKLDEAKNELIQKTKTIKLTKDDKLTGLRTRISEIDDRVRVKLEDFKTVVEKIEKVVPKPNGQSELLSTESPADWKPEWWKTQEPPTRKPAAQAIAMDAYRSADDDPTAFFNSTETEVFDNVVLDTNSTYNATSGVFTSNIKCYYLVIVQVANTDNMFTLFNLVYKSSWSTDIISSVSSEIDQGMTMTLVYMNAGDELYVVPDESSSDFNRNVKPGVTSRLSVFCLLHRLPMIRWQG